MKKKLIDFESVTAIILSFIGGLLDVYCLFNFDIYGMLQTGNLIKLVMNLIDGNITMFLATLSIILSFTIGIFFAILYDQKRKNKSVKGLLIITMVLLLFTIMVPNNSEPRTLSYVKFIATLLFGLEGAFIFHSFARFGDYAFSSTMMTANIKRFVSNIYERVVNKDKTKGYGIFTYFFIILFFLLGVAAGYCYMKFMPRFTEGFMGLYEYNLILFVPLLLLFITMILTIKIDAKYHINEKQ